MIEQENIPNSSSLQIQIKISNIPKILNCKSLLDVNQRHSNIVLEKEFFNSTEKGNILKQKNNRIVAEQKQPLSTLSPINLQKKINQFSINGHCVRSKTATFQLNGKIEINYQNGIKFKGVYQKGRRRSGSFQFQNGIKYTGGFYNDQFQGYGQLLFQSGKKIKGKWANLDIIDNGIIEYPNGDVYFGSIRNLKKQGEGYLFFNNGNKYIGQFQHGKITGFGMYYINNVKQYQGYWNNGIIVVNSQKYDEKTYLQLFSNKSFITQQQRMLKSFSDINIQNFQDVQHLKMKSQVIKMIKKHTPLNKQLKPLLLSQQRMTSSFELKDSYEVSFDIEFKGYNNYS